MKINVKLGEPFWRQIGEKRVTLHLQSDATVQDMIIELGNLYPTLREYLNQEEVPPTVFLADEIVSVEAVLKEGDCPTLIWAVSGG